MSESTIPTADPDDSEEIVAALETARAEWARGAHREAIEWLRQAVAACAEAGRAERAAALQSLLLDLAEIPSETELSDVDDFSDETIVDQAPRILSQMPRPTPPVTKIATAPTPVARPPRPSKGPPTYGAVRVSVRRALGGKWVVRPLGERESAPAGEEEALLVPLRPGAKFG